jgi:hypothetical protein
MVLLAVSFLSLTEAFAATPDAEKDYQAYLDNLYSIVRDTALEGPWLGEGDRLLYRRRGGDSVWIVDPVAKTKTLLVNLKDFAAKAHIDLTTALLRKTSVRLSSEKPKVEIDIADKKYIFDPSSGTVETPDTGSTNPNPSPTASEARQIRKPTLYYGSPSIFEVRSPNAQLFATEQDHNLAIRRSNDNSIERLTEDGTEKAFWSVQGASWSPDS